jgi:hypothetical protein
MKRAKRVVKLTADQLVDEKYIGKEPEWHGKKFTDAELEHAIIRGLNYYAHFFSGPEFKKEIEAWLQVNSKFTKAQIEAYRNSPDGKSISTLGGLVRMHTRGAPLRQKHIDYILRKVQEVSAKTDSVLEKIQTETVPAVKTGKKAVVNLIDGIQARMLNQARDIAGEIDGDLDDAVTTGAGKLDVYKYLVEKQISRPVAAKIRAFYEGDYAEIKASKAKDADPQLAEAYAFLKGANLKRVLAWFEKTFSDLDNYVKLKSLDKKPRKRKAISAEKTVSRMKFLREYKELNLVSISPTEIVKAEQLWVFNTKTRKLGRYVAESGNTLTVKGTTIQNYNERESIAKTVRKPKEKLPELMKAGKVNLRKFMDTIKATSTKLNGRINADTLLLRVA